MRDDFHTFERQKKVNSGRFRFGHSLILITLFINSAEVIFILMIFWVKYYDEYYKILSKIQSEFNI